MLTALFVGLGGIGQRHLRNLRTLLGGEVRVLAHRVRGETTVVSDDLQAVPGADLCREYDVEVFGDLDQALRERPDVAFVTNPTSEHVRVALHAAAYGCHLFVEKPLSHDRAAVRELVRVVEERGTVGFVAYQLRFHPAFRRLRAWLEEGAVGRVLCARAEVGEWLPGFHPYEDYRRMYASKRALGGGVAVTQIHELDLLYALFGVPERVFSLGGQVSDLEVDVEDLASSLLDYRHLDGRAMPVHVHQDYFQRPKARGLFVVGTRGRIDWDLARGTLVRWTEAGGEAERHDYSEHPRNWLFLDELEHFLACVRGEATPEVTLRDGAESLGLALAIQESQRTGVPVATGRFEGHGSREVAA